MKVVIVSTSLPPLSSGGIASAHCNLFKVLRRKGVTVRAVTYLDRETTDPDPDVIRHGLSGAARKFCGKATGALFTILGCRGQVTYQVRDILVSAGAWRINRDIEAMRPDLVVLPDHGAPGLYIRKPSACRFVWVSHHNPARFLENPLIPRHCAPDGRIALWMEKMALRGIDHVICPSRYMGEVFQRTYGLEVPVTVLPNLVDSDTIERAPIGDTRSELGLGEGDPVIFVPSAGSVFKGARYLERVLAGVWEGLGGKAGFFLSGPVDSEVLHRIGKVVPPGKILAPGHLPYLENVGMMKGCSICVSPTLMESFGMALLESMACGLPVVAFDAGGNRDLVRNGVNGFLVPAGDAEGLVRSCLQVLRGGDMPGYRLRARDLFEGVFSEAVLADRYLDLFEGLLALSPRTWPD